MWFPPENLDETTRLIVESGIGRRVFGGSYLSRVFDYDAFEEFKFWVQVDADPIARQEVKHVVVWHPDLHRAESFTAERGLGFADSPWGLEPEQMRLVERLASEWRRHHQPTRTAKRHVS